MYLPDNSNVSPGVRYVLFIKNSASQATACIGDLIQMQTHFSRSEVVPGISIAFPEGTAVVLGIIVEVVRVKK